LGNVPGEDKAALALYVGTPRTLHQEPALPHTPRPRSFKSRNAYYAQLEGKQHRLADGPKDEPDGPTYRAAVQRFAEILPCAPADKAEDDNLVIPILDRYAVHLENAV
jgi:hypothetical protein